MHGVYLLNNPATVLSCASEGEARVTDTTESQFARHEGELVRAVKPEE